MLFIVTFWKIKKIVAMQTSCFTASKMFTGKPKWIWLNLDNSIVTIQSLNTHRKLYVHGKKKIENSNGNLKLFLCLSFDRNQNCEQLKTIVHVSVFFFFLSFFLCSNIGTCIMLTIALLVGKAKCIMIEWRNGIKKTVNVI